MEISILKKEYANQIDALDLDIIIAHVLGKTREFVLAHPEFPLTASQGAKIAKLIKRRISHEPLAYLTGTKEFYGLNFKVNKSTLIPRPETELLVELVTKKILKANSYHRVAGSRMREKLKAIIDVGTGSGNIIISTVKNCHPELDSGSQRRRNKFGMTEINYFATDISEGALQVAKQNAKFHKVDKQIKFLQSNLLDFLMKDKLNSKFKIRNSKLIILANLPYLSKEIYERTDPTVKKFEPKSALFSKEHGLSHYKKLLQQIKKTKKASSYKLQVTSYFEISPEQKPLLETLIKSILPKVKIKFHKDWARKWRICEIEA